MQAPIQVETSAAPAIPETSPSFWHRLRHRDHTRGNLLTSVAVLSVPAVASSVAGMGIFQLVDLYFLGQLGAAAQAAAGATHQTLRQGVLLLVIGLSTAAQTLISSQIGRGDVRTAERLGGQTLLLAAILSVLAALCGSLIPTQMISLVTSDPAVIELGTGYLRITFAWMFSFVAVQLASAVLTGAGDTTTPMLVNLIVTPLSIVAEWALGFGHLGAPALGIDGLALGAGLGSFAGTVALGVALASGRCRIRLRASDLMPHGDTLQRLLSYAWQPALHMVARTLILFFFMGLAGRLGRSVQAAYTIGLRFEMLLTMIALPIGNACAILVGQNLGAGDALRARRSITAAWATSVALLMPGAIALFLLRDWLVTLFTSDPDVALHAAEYLGYSAFVLAFYSLYFVTFRALQAAGDMRTPTILSVSIAVFLAAPLGYYLAMHTDLGPRGLWIGVVTYVGVNTTLTVIWLLIKMARWRRAEAINGTA